MAQMFDCFVLLKLCEIGHSSPVLSRSHIAVPGHKKKRSILQAEAMPAREYTV